MTATFFINLALGGITAFTSAIMALSGWVTGSLIVSGNLFFDTTNSTTPAVYVNTQQILSVAASGVGFITNGTQSGVTLKDNSTTAFASYQVNCTATGGNVKVSNGAKYDTCIIPPLLSSSGTITRLDLMIASAPVGTAGIDCGFVKARNSGTGVLIQNFNGFAASSGGLVTFSTGSLRWNGADFIKCGTLTNPGPTFSAKLKVNYFDDTSE